MIDTNRKSLFGKLTNATVCSVIALDGSQQIIPAVGIVFGETIGNPEVFTWRHFIESICKQERYESNKEYALIVDSELSELEDFNQQTKPIRDQFYIPKNWRLIYVTTDKPGDSFLNKAISKSDNVASRLLSGIGRVDSNAGYLDSVVDEITPDLIRVRLRHREQE